MLLDVWPLQRFGGPRTVKAGRIGSLTKPMAQAVARPVQTARRLVLEKLPLVPIVLVVVGITMGTHGLAPDALTLSERLANAIYSAVAYLGQLFVPVGLSNFYAHPEAGRPWGPIAAALVLLLAISAAAVYWRRSAPYFFVGWFWYLGMLVPVSGVVFIGPQARADRYTYLSQIGLYIALAWGAKELSARWPARAGCWASARPDC